MGGKINRSEDLGSAMLGLATESGTVITQRVTQMLTGRMSASEAMRMSAEKHFALAEAMTRAGMGTLRGDFPMAVWADALMPFRLAVSANAERLGEAGDAPAADPRPEKRGVGVLPGRFRPGPSPTN